MSEKLWELRSAARQATGRLDRVLGDGSSPAAVRGELARTTEAVDAYADAVGARNREKLLAHRVGRKVSGPESSVS